MDLWTVEVLPPLLPLHVRSWNDAWYKKYKFEKSAAFIDIFFQMCNNKMAAVPRKVLAFSLMAVNFGIFGMEIVDEDMCTFCVEHCNCNLFHIPEIHDR